MLFFLERKLEGERGGGERITLKEINPIPNFFITPKLWEVRWLVHESSCTTFITMLLVASRPSELRERNCNTCLCENVSLDLGHILVFLWFSLPSSTF